jgi:dTDP-glucose 4,6-dehydratase
MILKLLDKPESLIKYVKDRPGHDRRYSLNSNKIKSELGWYPKHKFEDALKQTVNWYVENRKWWLNIKKKQQEYIEFYKKQYEQR